MSKVDRSKSRRHRVRGNRLLSAFNQIIGAEATHRLVADFRGTRLYVPRSPKPDDPISRSIGLEKATTLARVYAGERVDIPNPITRRERILELRAAGHRVEAIARELGCTQRRVYQVLAEARREHNS